MYNNQTTCGCSQSFCSPSSYESDPCGYHKSYGCDQPSCSYSPSYNAAPCQCKSCGCGHPSYSSSYDTDPCHHDSCGCGHPSYSSSYDTDPCHHDSCGCKPSCRKNDKEKNCCRKYICELDCFRQELDEAICLIEKIYNLADEYLEDVEEYTAAEDKGCCHCYHSPSSSTYWGR